VDAVQYPPARLTNLELLRNNKKGLIILLGITMGEQYLRPNKRSKLKIYFGVHNDLYIDNFTHYAAPHFNNVTVIESQEVYGTSVCF
jgi:hypothetical protein